MADRHRLAGVLAALGAVVTAVLVVRGWLALRDLLNPPQLATEDVVFQLSTVALPLVGAFLVAVRRAAVGVVLLAAYGALELPALIARIVRLAQHGADGQATTHGLEVAAGLLLAGAGALAWSARSGRVRTVRSRVQPVVWVAAAAVALQGVFPAIGHRIGGFSSLQPPWFEPLVLRTGPVQAASIVVTLLLVAGVVTLAAGWPRDIAAGAFMAVSLPVLLGGIATLTRALRDPEMAPTVWAWIVPAGAAVLVALATWWWDGGQP